MCVAKCVKTTPRDPQRVQDRPQVIFHDFVGRWGPPISCHKKEARLVGLPGDPIVLEHREQRDDLAHSELAAHDAQELSGRSEEHTSELQSQSNLVCRLLLEKKKKV